MRIVRHDVLRLERLLASPAFRSSHLPTVLLVAAAQEPVSRAILHEWGLAEEETLDSVTSLPEIFREVTIQEQGEDRVCYSTVPWMVSALASHPSLGRDLAATHRRIAGSILDAHAEGWKVSLTESSLYALRFVMRHLSLALGMGRELRNLCDDPEFARTCAEIAILAMSEGLRKRPSIRRACWDLHNLALALLEAHPDWPDADARRCELLASKARLLRIQMGRPEEALECAMSASRLAAQLPASARGKAGVELADALHASTYVYKTLGRPLESLDCANKMVGLLRQFHDPDGELVDLVESMHTLRRGPLLLSLARRSSLHPCMGQRLLDHEDRRAYNGALATVMPEGLADVVVARLQSTDVMLHDPFWREPIRLVRLRPAVVLDPGERGDWRWKAREVAEAVARFHLREFGNCAEIAVEDAVYAGEASYPQVARAMCGDSSSGRLDLLPGLSPAREGESILLLHVGREMPQWSHGLGKHPWALVAMASGGLEATAAHEFYHALLGLSHTNGAAGFLDPESVMYTPLASALSLERTYVSPWQKALCLTTLRAQRLINVGNRLERRARYGKALLAYQEALEEDVFHLWLHQRLAELLSRSGRTEDALATLRHGARLHPSLKLNEAELLFDLGRSREARGVLPSISGLGKARLTPLDRASHYCDLGTLYCRCGLIHEAIRQYRRSLRIDERASARDGLGRALHIVGNIDGAVRQFRRAVTLGPASAGLHMVLAWGLAGQGRFRASRRHIRLASSHVNDRSAEMCDIRPKLAALQCVRGRRELAIHELSLAIKANPQDPTCYQQLGFLHLATGDRKAARHQFRQCLGLLLPHSVAARSVRVVLLWLSGRNPMTAIRRSRRLLMRYSPLLGPLYVLSQAFPGTLYERWYEHVDRTRPLSLRQNLEGRTRASSPRGSAEVPAGLPGAASSESRAIPSVEDCS